MSLSTFAQTIATPEQYLYSIPKPNFKRGHTLKLLTYTGWGSENSNTVVELADKWGYALDFGVATRYGVTTLLTNSQNRNYGFAQLVNSDSNKFKAAWHCIKQFDIESYLTSGYTNKDQVTGRFYSKSCYATNASGDYLDPQGNISATPAVFSVHMPNADLQRQTDAQIELLKIANSNCPISIIINDGEWGLYEYSGHWRAHHKDPRFVADMAAQGVTIVPDVYNADFKIYQYFSQKKSRELSFLARAIATNFPNAFYYWYKTDAEKGRYYGRVAGTDYGTNYSTGSNFDSRYVATNFALPICESYFWSANVGLTNNYTAYGIDIAKTSMPFQFENWAGYQNVNGRPLSYNYLSAGWGRAWMTNASIPSYLGHQQYMGLLKCYYTLGMIGGNAGNYEDFNTPFNAPFPPSNPPQWLTQKIALALVHAQFSWLEDYLRNGSLVAGPYTNLLSTDRMSYDFNQGTNGANTAHIFVRKKNDSNSWLITAWTADATNSNVTIAVPTLGTVTVRATQDGTVYTATTNKLTVFIIPPGTPQASPAAQ